MSEPLRFIFGLHLHQPVGNFDYVFADHVRDVYRPILERTAAAGFGPVTVHISGPLFDWLEEHDTAYLDFIGRLAADHKIELLLAGYDEPILASLPRRDRVEQVQRMKAYLRSRFGVDATGLWLTERVWEPELAADLHDAGVGYALVDDRHFLVTGFKPEQLHLPWRTESDGKAISLLAIDEQLRYFVPFRPPEETAAYLRRLRSEGHRLAILADDGEKFGGWPGTLDWVYTRGWLDDFLRTIHELIASGEVRLSTGAEAVQALPAAGLAYLPTASYREMEAWSAPADAQQALTKLEEDLGPERMKGPTGPLIRGAHWRNFLAKYAESNRMHKVMVALSGLAHERGDPPAVRRAISRAQCNDAYWHGVFGGLYLPILRNAIWRQLAIAEGGLRAGEALACEVLDLDVDGADEYWVHSSAFSALVSPRRGGAIEVLMRFAEPMNVADALTRRREAYHQPGLPVDHETRALFVDRVLPGALSFDDYRHAAYRAITSWAAAPLEASQCMEGDALVIALRGAGIEKTLAFSTDGTVRVQWRWDRAACPADAFFATELSLAKEREMELAPGGDIWTYRIVTFAKSERGLDETEQGLSVTARWPATLGEAWLVLK